MKFRIVQKRGPPKSLPPGARLSDELLRQLRIIDPSFGLVDANPLYPIEATLRDRTTQRHCYAMPVGASRRTRDYLVLKAPNIETSKIKSFRENADRIPPKFANLLYAMGENHMGGLTFQLTFADGNVANYGFAGGLLRDFLALPPKYKPTDIVELDFLSRKKATLPGSFGVLEDHVFCFFPDDQIPHPPAFALWRSFSRSDLETRLWR